MRHLVRLILLCCLVVAPRLAFAQETGSISGKVLGPTGDPVAGASVRVSGKGLPAPRTTVTSADGAFVVPLLLPGDYKVDVEKNGIGKATRDAMVSLDRDTQVDVILGSQVAERVTITGAVTPIDLKSAEVSTNYTRAFIQNLPLDRSYLGLLQLVPGVADNGGFSPNGGGSRLDNTFLIDGVSITGNLTNPLFGYLSNEVNEFDITELNIKRAAVSAEFGRTAGILTNAVTRSGSNAFSGGYRFEAIPAQWITVSSKAIRNPADRWANSFGIGGPVRKDHLFFYVSARSLRTKVSDAINNFGAIPDRIERTEDYFAKLTGIVGSKQSIGVSVRYQPSHIRNFGIGANDEPSVGTNQKETQRIVSANLDRLIDTHTTFSIRFVHTSETSDATPTTDFGFQPTFDDHNLGGMGRYVVGGKSTGAASLRQNHLDFGWNEIKAAMTRTFQLGTMAHYAKIGVGAELSDERLARQSNGWGDIAFVINNGVGYILATYLPAQSPQENTAHTYSWFLQDTIAVTPRLTVNAGLLFDKDTFAQTAPVDRPFLSFGFVDEIQPRIGANFQMRKGKKEKIYGHWGRYTALDQRSSGRALATGRFQINESLFGLDEAGLVSTTQLASSIPKTAAADLDAPSMNEAVIGYAARMFGIWSLDTYFMYRANHNFIEDAPTTLPFSGFIYANDPGAARTFKTFTISMTRPLANRWAFSASYAWSRFAGTYDQDYSTALGGSAVFTSLSLIDDGPGAFTDDRFRNGVLSQDRTHVYKILATWLMPWLNGASLGAYVRGQSGTPWEARGLPWSSTTTYLRYLEPAGSHRNPFWTNVDLLGKYTRRLNASRAVSIEARLLNTFNQETALSVDQRNYLDPRVRTLVGTPTPGCRSCFTDAMIQGVTLPNPRFGQAIAFAQPRRLLLSLLFDF